MVSMVTPYKEAADMLKQAGGETLDLCYQCGLCTGACPWNLTRSFAVRRIIHQAQLGVVDFESEDTWLCATCGACVARCPRGVEIIDVMRAVRRTVAELGVGEAPPSVRNAIKSISAEGNPWSGARENRADWTRGLGTRTWTEGTELLYYPCCLVAYDASVTRVGKAVVKILQALGTDFALMGTEEECCGESARKAGNEPLFQELVARNTQRFSDKGVGQMLVSSPHCYYTFRNEYGISQNGVNVQHVTQFLAGQLREGGLKLTVELPPKRVAYHDPCYLGRHSGIYDEPREVLSSIPGVELVEMVDNRENSLCCGAGGSRVWAETPMAERFVSQRVRQALDVGAEVLATACPYCLLMIESHVLADPQAQGLQVRDVSELVAEAL